MNLVLLALVCNTCNVFNLVLKNSKRDKGMRMPSMSENRFVDFDDQDQFSTTALPSYRHFGRYNPKTKNYFKV